MKRIVFIFTVLICLCSFTVNAKVDYIKGFRVLENMLNGTDSLDLSKAVFYVENAYYEGNLSQPAFEGQIKCYSEFCRSIANSGMIRYTGSDSASVNMQGSVFAFMTDFIPFKFLDKIIIHPPFQYNYEDFAGEKEWSNMFVTTLMATGKGNCHSMPLLYKLIMDELGEKCWLALAPTTCI